jgi:hypothetical protein
MIRQARIRVQVEETDAAVTGLGGVPALVNLAHEMGLFKDVDALLPPKERDRGYSPSASTFDLMLIPWAGGACIDDLAVLRADQGLERLLHRPVMAPSTAHDFLRRMQYVGLEGLAKRTRSPNCPRRSPRYTCGRIRPGTSAKSSITARKTATVSPSPRIRTRPLSRHGLS